ncbi:N-acetyltransferase [Paenibacillus sp. URB8-2]|nr:N-acetyltransferase [Paenibacillus sp. URB8-2]
MTNRQYEILERLPTVMEHNALWKSVGWGEVDPEMTECSIAGSVHGVVAVCGEEVIGMGRTVGDGSMYFYIQDVAVLPEHQHKGVGQLIVERLLADIEKRRISGGIAFVGLFAATGKEVFYERFGFKDHSPDMTGMFAVLK